MAPTDNDAASGEEGTGDAPALGLFEAARRHGAYTWVEQRLFALSGAWAAAPGLPDVARVHLFEASAQHAWHADLWSARLPVLAGVDADALVVPAGDGAPALLDALEIGAVRAASGDEEEAGRRFLAAFSGAALPRLLASYRSFARHLSPVSDGPSIRVLAHVVADIEAEAATLSADLAATGGGSTSGLQAAWQWCVALEGLLGGSATDGLFAWENALAGGG